MLFEFYCRYAAIREDSRPVQKRSAARLQPHATGNSKETRMVPQGQTKGRRYVNISQEDIVDVCVDGGELEDAPINTGPEVTYRDRTQGKGMDSATRTTVYEPGHHRKTVYYDPGPPDAPAPYVTYCEIKPDSKSHRYV